MSCVLFGSVIDFVAFGLAPQSLLAPLAALSLVWNLGMAWYLLGEKYTQKDLYATITIFVGTGLSVSNAPHNEVEYNMQDLLKLWGEDRMFYYSIVVPIILLLHYFLVFFTENPSHPVTPSFFKLDSYEKSTSQTTGSGSNSKSLFRNRLREGWKPKLLMFLRMAGYAGFAGVVGGQSLLFAKSVVELIKAAFKGDDGFWHIQTYLIIGMLLICLSVQIQFLNGGLKYFDSLYVVPVYQSYWILAGVIGGLVYFGEWDAMSSNESRLFVLGIFITFLGLYILTQKEHAPVSNLKSEEVKVTGEESEESEELLSVRERRKQKQGHEKLRTKLSSDEEYFPDP